MAISELYPAIGQSMIGQYAVYFANAASTIMLARIFGPEVYGLVTAAMVAGTLFQFLSAAGLTPALINVDDFSRDLRDGVFSFTLILGSLFGAALYLLKNEISAFFNSPAMPDVLVILAPSVTFFAASVTPKALLLRERKFLLLAACGFTAIVVSTILAISVSLIIEPEAAMAIKFTAYSVINFTLVWLACGRLNTGRPLVGRQLGCVRAVARFSIYQLGYGFTNFTSKNFDSLLVGKYLGTDSLGMYNAAFRLAQYPVMLLTQAINPAIQPVLKHHSNSPQTLAATNNNLSLNLSILGSLASIVCFFATERIVLITLGIVWSEVVPVLQIFFLAIPVQAVLSSSAGFFKAARRPDLMFRVGLINATINILAICYGVYLGDMIFLAWCMFFSFYFNFAVTYVALYRKVFFANVGSFLCCILITTLTPAAIVLIGAW